MSYSFNVTADTKDQAGEMVEAELGKVVLTQPVHDNDRQAAQDAAEAAINLLVEPKDGECVRVSVSGYLSWVAENAFVSASINVTVGIGPKQ